MLELHVHQTPVLSHPNSSDWVSPPGDSGFQLWDNRLTREKGPAVSGTILWVDCPRTNERSHQPKRARRGQRKEEHLSGEVLHKDFYLFTYFWLHWTFTAAWAFLCRELRLLSTAVLWLLILVASPDSGPRLYWTMGSVVVHGLRSFGV